MPSKTNQQQFPTKTTYYFEEGGKIIVEVISQEPTMFPEKLARANEILKKAKLLPPVQRQKNN